MANSNSRVLSSDGDTSPTSSGPPLSVRRPITREEAGHLNPEGDNSLITSRLGTWGAPVAIVGVSLVLMLGAALAIPDPTPPEPPRLVDRYTTTSSPDFAPDSTAVRPDARAPAVSTSTPPRIVEGASPSAAMNVHKSRGFSPVRERVTPDEPPNEPSEEQRPKVRLAQQISAVGLGAMTSVRLPSGAVPGESHRTRAVAVPPRAPQESAPQESAPQDAPPQEQSPENAKAQDPPSQNTAPQESTPENSEPEPRPER